MGRTSARLPDSPSSTGRESDRSNVLLRYRRLFHRRVRERLTNEGTVGLTAWTSSAQKADYQGHRSVLLARHRRSRRQKLPQSAFSLAAFTFDPKDTTNVKADLIDQQCGRIVANVLSSQSQPKSGLLPPVSVGDGHGCRSYRRKSWFFERRLEE